MSKRKAAPKHDDGTGRTRAPEKAARPTSKRKPKSTQQRSKSLHGHGAPHARFPKTAGGAGLPRASKAPKSTRKKSPSASPRPKIQPPRAPSVSVFGRRLTPRPEPRT
jgi:hypothetical protein